MDFSTFCLWFAYGNVLAILYHTYRGVFIHPLTAALPVIALTLHFILKS